MLLNEGNNFDFKTDNKLSLFVLKKIKPGRETDSFPICVKLYIQGGEQMFSIPSESKIKRKKVIVTCNKLEFFFLPLIAKLNTGSPRT